MSDDGIGRRPFLKGVTASGATALTGSIAGCLGDGDDTGDDLVDSTPTQEITDTPDSGNTSTPDSNTPTEQSTPTPDEEEQWEQTKELLKETNHENVKHSMRIQHALDLENISGYGGRSFIDNDTISIIEQIRELDLSNRVPLNQNYTEAETDYTAVRYVTRKGDLDDTNHYDTDRFKNFEEFTDVIKEHLSDVEIQDRESGEWIIGVDPEANNRPHTAVNTDTGIHSVYREPERVERNIKALEDPDHSMTKHFNKTLDQVELTNQDSNGNTEDGILLAYVIGSSIYPVDSEKMVLDTAEQMDIRHNPDIHGSGLLYTFLPETGDFYERGFKLNSDGEVEGVYRERELDVDKFIQNYREPGW